MNNGLKTRSNPKTVQRRRVEEADPVVGGPAWGTLTSTQPLERTEVDFWILLAAQGPTSLMFVMSVSADSINTATYSITAEPCKNHTKFGSRPLEDDGGFSRTRRVNDRDTLPHGSSARQSRGPELQAVRRAHRSHVAPGSPLFDSRTRWWKSQIHALLKPISRDLKTMKVY